MSDSSITNLQQFLNHTEKARGDAERISPGRCWKPGGAFLCTHLLVAALVTLAPGIGDIPEVPTVMAAVVFVTATQLLFHRYRLWLPEWLLNRSIAR